MASRQAYTVSGPGVDRSYPAGPVALSAAITIATAAQNDVTLYVREPDGSPFGRVERDAASVRVYREGGKR